MRLIKPNDYSVEDWRIAYTGDAFSHPVRKKIIEHLVEEGGLTLSDYGRLMNLSKIAIKQHLEKLELAKLIIKEYHTHYQILSLDTTELEIMYEFLGKVLKK